MPSEKKLDKLIRSDERLQRMAGSGEEGSEWLTTYGDLMTLLLVFFVLFYIFSITGQLPLLTDALQAFQETDAVVDAVPEAGEQQEPGEIVISIPSVVLFDLGKAELKPAALDYLDQAVDSIKIHMREDPMLEIRIEGYTDNIPIHNWQYRSNWELSAARAIAVVRYFIEEHQFQPEVLQAMGYGEYNPLVPNDTPENRQMNRRVEIKLVRGTTPRPNNHLDTDSTMTEMEAGQ